MPQIYVSPVAGGWEAPKRLAGFRSVELEPDAETVVTLTLDPRLLAVFDSAPKRMASSPRASIG